MPSAELRLWNQDGDITELAKVFSNCGTGARSLKTYPMRWINLCRL